jgi:hypothetical protein
MSERTSRQRVAWGAALAACMVGSVALAEPSELELLRGQLEDVTLRLESLEGDVGAESRLSITGYGDLHLNTSDRPGSDDELDFHRLAIGFGYELSDWVRVSAEIDFEHAAQELELEFAHVDFLLSEALNIRLGAVLMPMGPLNEFHEPTLFYSVERPYLNKYMVPTTWSAGGGGAFGFVGPLAYRAYLVNGLDATGFSAKSGIRGGRQILEEAKVNDAAVVGRLEGSPASGVQLGVSGYYGNSGQDTEGLGETPVTIVEGDVAARRGCLELRAMVVGTYVGDTEQLSEQLGETIGEEMFGWNVELALHFAGKLLPEGQDLVPFVRYETFDTQASVAEGLERSGTTDRDVVTAGLAYFPIAAVVLKGDAEWWSNADGEEWQNINLGVAYSF